MRDSTAAVVVEETRGPSRILRLHRPEARNALSAPLVTALSERLDEAEGEAAIRCVILMGDGPDFCAGADLRDLQQMAQRSREENLADSRRFAGLLQKIHGLGKPVIAAVHGNALAGGSGLVCACDFAIAAADAHFGFTEARIGFIPAIVSIFLMERVGQSRARELMLSARRVEAGEALSIGLIHERTESGSVLTRALEVAGQWSRSAPSSLANTKKLLTELPGMSIVEALDLAVRYNADARAGDEFREGIAAFFDKRKAPWVAEP